LTTYVQKDYSLIVLKKLTTWVDTADMKKLAALTKKKRLKVSQLIRIAIAEYIEREAKC